jgi:hypothetical protein
MKEIYVAEFSMEQRAFHATTLNRLIKDNVDMIKQKLSPHFVPIGYFDTEEDCESFINQCKEKQLFKEIRGG